MDKMGSKDYAEARTILYRHFEVYFKQVSSAGRQGRSASPVQHLPPTSHLIDMVQPPQMSLNVSCRTTGEPRTHYTGVRSFEIDGGEGGDGVGAPIIKNFNIPG